MSLPLLEFDRVSYRYPQADRVAIKELSLAFPEGKKVALLGHNGCGKSTLLLLANGLYPCQSGTVRWRGEPLVYQHRPLQQWRQRIGLAFQDPERQLVAATVAEDISYGLCNLPLSDTEIGQRLQQTLSDFQLQPLAHSLLHHLSLGQKRRVALAGVMALQPELLLLDEPTAYLDSRQTHNLLQELDRIYQQGTTIVMATHEIDLAYGWADWLVLLREGELAWSGQPQSLPDHLEVLTRCQLGLPSVLQLWLALPEVWRSPSSTPPRTVLELQTYLQKLA
jgi:cobalt/nickel transport system ATP-binding protein